MTGKKMMQLHSNQPIFWNGLHYTQKDEPLIQGHEKVSQENGWQSRAIGCAQRLQEGIEY